MSDFIESAKNFVNAAVSRTGWEANKQMRQRNKQVEIDKLLEQRQQLLNDLSLAAMNLYQQGALTDPQLSRLCASVLELDSDVRNRETQLQDIKGELYPADQLEPQSSTPNYTPSSSYGTPPASSASSASPVYQSPSASPAYGTPSSAPKPTPVSPAGTTGSQNCPTCGNPLRPNALYCRSCGAKLR
jgi:hypothetical protein